MVAIQHSLHEKDGKLSSILLKVKTSIGNASISKNEMEALITNHVKEYVLTNTWWYKISRETAY